VNLPKPLQRWQKPVDNFIKINSDGAFLADTGEGGWGYVIRDGEGEVISAGAGKLSHLKDAPQAEIRACMQGAKAAADLGMGKVILETDSLILVRAMMDNSYRLALIGGSILELQNFIADNFICSKVVYVPRICNKADHAIAELGRLCPQETDLAWNGLPNCIEAIVASNNAEPIS
jgi:ribonuclease HI